MKPWKPRFIMVDQSRKLTGSLNQIVAKGSGAIGLLWDSAHEIEREFRANHSRWHGKFFPVKGNWAETNGWIETPETMGTAYVEERFGEPSGKGADDNIVLPGRAINCQCTGLYLYDLEDLPRYHLDDWLTEKGTASLQESAA
jgi:hypothetical protein